MKKVIGLSGREAEVLDFAKLVTDEVKAGEEKKAQPKAQAQAKPAAKKEEGKTHAHQLGI